MTAGRDDHRRAAVAPQGGHHAGPYQGRLAAAGRSDDDEHAGRLQPPQAGRDIGVPAEELLRVRDVVGHQAAVRAAARRLRQSLRGRQRGVLAQDRGLHGDQVRAGLQTELSPEHGPGVAQRRQRLGLPSGLVLGQGRQRPPPLAQRRLRDPRRRLGEHFQVPSGPQGRLKPQLLGVEAHLVEPLGRDPPRLPSLQVGQRPPAPQGRRLAEREQRPVGVPQREQLARPAQSRSNRRASTSSAPTARR